MHRSRIAKLALAALGLALACVSVGQEPGQLRWAEVRGVGPTDLRFIGDAMADGCIELKILVPTRIDPGSGLVVEFSALGLNLPVPPGEEGCAGGSLAKLGLVVEGER